MSWPLTGRIWMVISRARSDCQSPAAVRIIIPAPTVSEARNVMMATTATSARPEIEFFGTIGVLERGSAPAGWACDAILGLMCRSLIGSIVDVQPAVVQYQTAGVELIHQRNVVGRDQH